MDTLLSPSKARRNATTAKDWAHVATWLTAKFHPASVPRFERNDDTLRMLLELARDNERADELGEQLERAAEAQVEENEVRWRLGKVATRSAMKDRDDGIGGEVMRWIDDVLRQEAGKGMEEILDDLANAGVELGCLDPADPVEAGQAVVELTQEEFAVREQVRRVEELQSHIDGETRRLKNRLEGTRKLRSSVDEAVGDMANQIGEWNRGCKMLALKLREYEERVNSLERADYAGVEFRELREQEQEVGRMQETCRSLQRGLREFGGLPPDWEAARGELERAEDELGDLRGKRDQLFEKMVERDARGK